MSDMTDEELFAIMESRPMGDFTDPVFLKFMREINSFMDAVGVKLDLSPQDSAARQTLISMMSSMSSIAMRDQPNDIYLLDILEMHNPFFKRIYNPDWEKMTNMQVINIHADLIKSLILQLPTN